MIPRFLFHLLTAGMLVNAMPVGVTRAEGAQPSQDGQYAGHDAGPLPEAVREATGRFLDVNEAIAAGYVDSGSCVSGPAEGAMGVHYVNPGLFDGQLAVESPEALVYEPTRNGRLELVAVEYVAPAEAWHAAHGVGVQPDVMGHLFHFVPGPNRYGPAAFYELHVWAWRKNKNGPFSDWNPAVSCAALGAPTF